jgi:hypothetical protein
MNTMTNAINSLVKKIFFSQWAVQRLIFHWLEKLFFILFLHFTILRLNFLLHVPLTLGLVIPYFFCLCHPVFCVWRLLLTSLLLVPSAPIARGLTPPDVAVHRKLNRTNRAKRWERNVRMGPDSKAGLDNHM